MSETGTKKGLITATVIGTVPQLAMVLAGHSNPAIAQIFAVGGMTISGLAGLGYALTTPTRTAVSAALGGAVAGGVCALIGIAVSFALGDVTAFILAAGTLSSAVAGVLGAVLGRVFSGKRAIAGA